MRAVNPSRIFLASCLALTVTAMTFAIRAGILGDLGASFSLSNTQLGWVNSMAFLGFPLATMLGGLIYNLLGPRKMMYIAFAGHLLGLALTVTATGFWGLLISTFFIGFANGSVEAACNPLIAEMYHDNKVTMLNRFHVWFPGGIVIGALLSAAMTKLGIGWQMQVAMIIVPTGFYGYLVFSTDFPELKHSVISTATNIRALFSPLYVFMLFCMSLTATTELGTQQWIERILSSSGAHPMLILAMVTGVMALGRQFAGPVIHRLHPTGVLLASAAIAAAGIYFMSMASGPMVYVAALMFAVGVMYFWPTMIGFVGEYLPKTGALGMSLMGGVGMFSAGWWQPVIGSWLDDARAGALAAGVSSGAADLAAGRATLANLAIFPLALIVLFGILHMLMRRRSPSKAR